MSQTHDSLLGLARISRGMQEAHDNIGKLLEIMHEPFEIKGRKIFVPTDSKIGFSWKAGCITYRPDITLEELREANRKLIAEKYSRAGEREAA